MISLLHPIKFYYTILAYFFPSARFIFFEDIISIALEYLMTSFYHFRVYKLSIPAGLTSRIRPSRLQRLDFI